MFFSTAAFGVERKAIEDVNVTDLIAETQRLGHVANKMEFAWWIPTEFWESAVSQDPSVTPEQMEEILDVFRPYSIFAAVQSTISTFGAFHFKEKDAVRGGLGISYIASDGKVRSLALLEDIDPDLEILLAQLTPMLAASMGNLGQNFYFFAVSDIDSTGGRLLSPYKSGKLIIEFASADETPPTKLQIETPLDSLFVPRVCPNGRAAHVTWKVCPWDGSALEQ